MTGSIRIAVFLLAPVCFGQKELSEAEQKELQSALSEAGSSPIEFTRALEKHLAKYPNTPQKDELERALVKAAIETNDSRRILRYGERVLATEPNNPQVLERVTRVLLANDDKDSAERALKYARKFEEILRALEKEGPSQQRNRAQMLEELDRALARALVFQARATGNLGNTEEAVALARKGWERYPTAESAREIGRWLARAGRDLEAVRHYAEAFTVSDPKNTDADRAKDRARMSELYRKIKGSEAGLGDLILDAYDRTATIAGQRLAVLRERDPNAERTDPMEFTLTAVKGEPLKLAQLRGKVLVLDFWATWCGPCRVQHPLYDEVKKRFAGRQDVVFLGINTDEEQSVVQPFLDANKWSSKNVFFEDGLGALLRVSSIPTTIVIDKQGQIFSRMNGFLPETFVDQLTSRIREALKTGVDSAAK
jgi:thiol-disulfide isomerase/thioredoxin/Flp pilus assembly protein TadD